MRINERRHREVRLFRHFPGGKRERMEEEQKKQKKQKKYKEEDEPSADLPSTTGASDRPGSTIHAR